MVEDDKVQCKRVTLEQLLSVKRAERPEPEFWERFDRELRQRQLSALVHARPWYLRVGHIARRTVPFTVAAAAVAVGYFVVTGPSVVVNDPVLAERYETIALTPAPQQQVASISVRELPEMIVQPVARSAGAIEARPQAVMANARYIVDVMAKDQRPQRFVTLDSPKTMLAGSSSGGTYVVNALSSQSSFGRPSSRRVTQF